MKGEHEAGFTETGTEGPSGLLPRDGDTTGSEAQEHREERPGSDTVPGSISTEMSADVLDVGQKERSIENKEIDYFTAELQL